MRRTHRPTTDETHASSGSTDETTLTGETVTDTVGHTPGTNVATKLANTITK